MFVKKAFQRTRARFQSLYETIKEDYWRTHDSFDDYGCSLRPIDISIRAAKAATWASSFLIFVTLPVILYYRGISEPSLFVGLALEFGFAWLMFFILVVAAHFLWAFTYIAGTKFGESELFLNYVGKRWGKRIDEIAKNFIQENKLKVVEFQSSEVSNDDIPEKVQIGKDENDNKPDA